VVVIVVVVGNALFEGMRGETVVEKGGGGCVTACLLYIVVGYILTTRGSRIPRHTSLVS